MAKRKNVPGVTAAGAEGRAIAVKMLAKIETYPHHQYDDLWPWSIKAMFRPPQCPQDNVVLRYLKTVQHDPELLAGFCAVLTDYLGSVEHSGTPNLEYFKKLTEREISGSPAPWPTMDDDDKQEKRELTRRSRNGSIKWAAQ